MLIAIKNKIRPILFFCDRLNVTNIHSDLAIDKRVLTTWRWIAADVSNILRMLGSPLKHTNSAARVNIMAIDLNEGDPKIHTSKRYTHSTFKVAAIYD